ncbi:MAG TPA: TetR/AcrR family transcriptional regulator [Candidatus Binataceae bacterium]|nr:TetR/AcrR family transcriptional regulator [Candidatus Binataceae bacterium]
MKRDYLSSSPPESNGTPALSKRARIIDAALHLFAHEPYQAVTMDRVAEAADVAKGTLYLYFQSKEDLYLGILTDCLESLSRIFFASVNPDANAKHRLRQAITTTFDFHARRPDLLRLIATEEPRLAEARNRLIEDWRDRGRQYYTDLIEQGIRSGEFRNIDPRLATHAIIGGFRQILLAYGQGRAVPELAREFAEMMVRALSAESSGYRRMAHPS